MSAWRSLVTLLDRREGGESLAVARVLAGGTLATHVATNLWSGAWRWTWVDERFGGLRDVQPGWLAYVGVDGSPETVLAFLVVLAAAGVAMAAGLFTRASALAAWVGYRALDGLNPSAGGSYDELLTNGFFLLVLSDCGAAWSVDAWRRGRARPVTAWPRWLLALQLVVMYESTAWQKVSSGWVPGGSLDALWYILQQPTWQRASMAWLAPAYPLTQAATLATWCIEHASPVLLLCAYWRATRGRGGWLRAQALRVDLRAWYLAVGMAMHLGVEMLMEVGPFLGGTMVLYAAWIAPDEWRRGWASRNSHSHSPASRSPGTR